MKSLWVRVLEPVSSSSEYGPSDSLPVSHAPIRTRPAARFHRLTPTMRHRTVGVDETKATRPLSACVPNRSPARSAWTTGERCAAALEPTTACAATTAAATAIPEAPNPKRLPLVERTTPPACLCQDGAAGNERQ